MKKLVVVGSGISGLAAAYYLRNNFEITIIEKNDYIGGHTHTHYHEIEKIYFDSGFIVLNNKNYPNFIKLLQELNIEYQKSDMSFSVSKEDVNYEWSGKNIRTIFDIKNIFSFRYLKVLKDIVKFSKICDHRIKNEDISLKTFLKKNNFSKEFIELYFFPMCSSIWSSDLDQIENYKACFILDFFKNHGLHNVLSKRPEWFTIRGGSKTYVDKIIEKSKFKIIKNERVKYVDQLKNILITHNNNSYQYDHLILASHANDSYEFLNNKSHEQEKLLSSVKYQKNKITIHSDDSIMPHSKKNWTSWNFKYDEKKLVLTYWMNLLQNLKCNTNIFVSLNSNKINETKIIKEIIYSHPIFIKSKRSMADLCKKAQGQNNIWFAGAWLGYGFHEDGLNSAINVYNLINAK